MTQQQQQQGKRPPNRSSSSWTNSICLPLTLVKPYCTTSWTWRRRGKHRWSSWASPRVSTSSTFWRRGSRVDSVIDRSTSHLRNPCRLFGTFVVLLSRSRTRTWTKLITIMLRTWLMFRCTRPLNGGIRLFRFVVSPSPHQGEFIWDFCFWRNCLRSLLIPHVGSLSTGHTFQTTGSDHLLADEIRRRGPHDMYLTD